MALIIVLVAGGMLIFWNKSGRGTSIPTNTPVVGSEVNSILVTASDLTKAGYTVIRQEKPANGQFDPPNVYFRVKESTDGNPQGDLVMIFAASVIAGSNDLPVYGSHAATISIPGAISAREGAIEDGRTAFNMNTARNYIVIIGPDAQKVEALAAILARR